MKTQSTLPSIKSETDVPIGDKAVEGEANRIEHLRLRRVKRDQVTPVPARLDALLPQDHLARLVWGAVEHLDLSAFYAQTTVREDGPGQTATDPKILLAVWLYATSQGVTRARELNRLCVEHLAYIWLCGGVTMNYHTLSDFRIKHAAALDHLMTEVLGHLIHAGVVEFEHGAQDGMRVRASAGAASFHRQPTLERSLEQAQQLVAALESSTPAGQDEDEDEDRGRGPGARERAARERVERLEQALAEMPAAKAAKPKGEEDKARVSSTDPEAHVMKMVPSDGRRRVSSGLQLGVCCGQRPAGHSGRGRGYDRQ